MFTSQLLNTWSMVAVLFIVAVFPCIRHQIKPWKEMSECKHAKKAALLPKHSMRKYREMYEKKYENPEILISTTETTTPKAQTTTPMADTTTEEHFPCGTRSIDTEAIIKGYDAQAGALPWQALVLGTNILCGGTLIARKWVLTAAHCVNDLQYVVLGEIDITKLPSMSAHAQIIHVESAITHKEYDPVGANDDIGLIKLKKMAKYNNYIRPACLPHPRTDFEGLDIECYISGWGYKTSLNPKTSSKLQQLRVQVMSQFKCLLRWMYFGFRAIKSSQICINPSKVDAHACHGDSGGPLSCNIHGVFYVAGTASFVGSNCSSRELPDVYTRTSSYQQWILQKMKENE